jgi:hypothetical protein
MALLITAAAQIGRSAYAENVHPVLEQYREDMFAQVTYEGTLPRGLGLPGYVCPLPQVPLAEGCEVKERTPLREVDEENPKDCLFGVGLVFDGYLPSVAMACKTNALRAVTNRQLMVTLEPDTQHFEQRAASFKQAIKPTERDAVAPSFVAWNSRFPKGRQIAHRQAAQRVADGEFDLSDVIKRNAFPKVEKILREGKGPYIPRNITGGSDEFNVMCGPWFYAVKYWIAETVYRALGWLMVNDQDAAQLGAYFESALSNGGVMVRGDDQLLLYRGVVFEGDGSKHDAHMHKLFMALKWALYTMFFHIPYLIVLVACQMARTTTATVRQFGIWYKHVARVRSGDWDTTEGNSIIVVFIAWCIYRVVKDNFDSPKLVDLVQDECKKLGYNLTLEIHHDPACASFLSGSFAPVGGRMMWYPHVGRTLRKLGWTIHRKGWAKMVRDYRSAVLSYRDFEYVPFLRLYVAHVCSILGDGAAGKRWGVKAAKGIGPPQDDTWDWFFRRYGLTREDEAEFGRALKACTEIPFMVHSAFVDRMAAVDCG